MKYMNHWRIFPPHAWKSRIGFSMAAVFGSGLTAWAITTGLGLVDVLHEPQAGHADQGEFIQLVQTGRSDQAFEEAFELGDELFAAKFNALDGVGANVGQGQRFTRVPRADLNGFGEWASHVPTRATGPNAESCSDCHSQPAEDGASPASGNVIRDPFHTGSLGSFINRNAPHLFGIGGVQRLAEEMTEELHFIRDAAVVEAQTRLSSVRQALQAKGVAFGFITAHADGSLDTSEVEGVDEDLVIRPFHWKGADPTVRAFNRGASHNELGMQAVELVGDGIDGDFDGVADEMTVGDQTALAVYNAAQPRPTTRMELAALGLIGPLSRHESAAIHRGGGVFEKIGCASCHVPVLTLESPLFSEPSQNPNYRDAVFPGGQDPVARGVDPAMPVTFDLTRDLPDNQITDAFGRLVFRLGNFEKDRHGRTLVRLFGDLKRHDMGAGLAESIDETGTGPSVFLTENLWGVGSTAPYLHDGRATTLTEAILEHGGEAEPSRQAFTGISSGEQAALVAFLENLVLFKMEEEEGEDPASSGRDRHKKNKKRRSGRR